MSLERYIELLQAIITMTNPENEEQMHYGWLRYNKRFSGVCLHTKCTSV